MGRIKKEDKDKAVRITITLDTATAKMVEKFANIEALPVSRFIARILKRYFEMK